MTRAFDQAKSQFLRHLESVKISSVHTVRNYKHDLKSFSEFLVQEKITIHAMEEIDKRTIRRYLSYLNFQEAAKRTLLRRLACLRSFFKYLKREKIVEHNPMEEIDSPKLEKTIPKSLSYSQVERLLVQPQTGTFLGFRDRCIMEMLYSSGLRISELVGLDREAFDERNQRLRILGKGKKERIVPITESAAKWLVDYLHHPERCADGKQHRAQTDSKAIFLNKWGKRITVRSVDRNFSKYLLASGLSQDVTPHTRVSTRLKREVYDKAHPSANIKCKK